MVSTLRILLLGPVGAGKSSFFNSVNNVLQGRMTTRALADSESWRSFTMECKDFRLKKKDNSSYPFMFTDIKGIEPEERKGVHPEDIAKILLGHIKNGYRFHIDNPITEENPKYNATSSLNDRVHCLVAVLSADKISLMDQDVINQMRKVREKARKRRWKSVPADWEFL
ncbi:interferon-induced protein 44-like [Labeo rohita]|uniref:interferon-induced protein 44-like n=1 Tax=Labeo rohita TaxID=84645 RepID=UPI0021E23111|nr:interferon-induced protein 44-like [Labeo rohita]